MFWKIRDIYAQLLLKMVNAYVSVALCKITPAMGDKGTHWLKSAFPKPKENAIIYELSVIIRNLFSVFFLLPRFVLLFFEIKY